MHIGDMFAEILPAHAALTMTGPMAPEALTA